MKDKTGVQAFPAIGNPETDNYVEGMTLRDYFAAKAMQSLIKYAPIKHNHEISVASYELADSMLKERDK